jgi:hypothetical protein
VGPSRIITLPLGESRPSLTLRQRFPVEEGRWHEIDADPARPRDRHMDAPDRRIAHLQPDNVLLPGILCRSGLAPIG